MTPIKRPPVFDVDHALKVYYGKGYISNADIKQIFGVKVEELERNRRKLAKLGLEEAK